jgi:hypothetical protein
VKVILTIGDCCFIANSAANAAKVADLLGDMEPVSRDSYYLEGDYFRVTVHEVPKYKRCVLISDLDPGERSFATLAEWRTFRESPPEPKPQQEGGAL